MKIACVSDLHGYLPDIPDCDLLLLAGDYCPTNRNQHIWFIKSFGPWLSKQSKTKKVIGVAGNHDFVFQNNPELLPQMDWIYLQDSGCEWNGLKFWGSPWQPWFYNWAFNAYEDKLSLYWDLIPKDTDILLLHGPPYGYGDFSLNGNEHTGSPSLLDKIKEIQPKLVIAGHIHSGYGEYEIGKTKFLSCAFVDDMYEPANKPHLIEL